MKKFIYLIFCFTLLVFTAKASEPKIWSVNTRAEVLKGDARGVSINENGTITLAPKLTQVFNTEQSYVWSSAVDASGNVFLGTGSDGKIFKVDASGKGMLFYDTNELNVAALAIGKNGEIFAGTSPDGKVYRVSANGTAEIFFEPKEKYIWSLAVLSDGSLAVGTGENGKIYRVKTANATPETSLLFDTSETHIISLAADNQGNLFAGTDANGLVLRFSPDGKPFALLDSPLREIHDISTGADGSVYVLAVSDAASASKATMPTTTTPPESPTVSVETNVAPTPELLPKSRYDLSTAKSAVYRILPDGGSDIIWNSASVTAFSIYAHQTGNGVLLGTSDKGRIYSIANDGRETLLLQSNEGQISSLTTDGKNLFATSSNQGKLYRFGAETEAEGNYESAVLDAKANATWGRIWWRSSGSAVLQTRSGNTEKADETWSGWSANYTDQKGAQITSPKAKYLQWRTILNSKTLPKGTTVFSGLGYQTALNEVNVSYLPRNIAPEVLSIQILPTNVGLLANPPVQIDPNIELSGLDPTAFGLPPIFNVPPRKVYLRGARALQWTAEDRNGDRLEYDIYYREVGEMNFKLLRENLPDNFFTIDGAALADGRYIFKVVAKDSLSNPPDLSLSGERISEPIDIDNTPPTVSAVGTPQIIGDKARTVFEANDSASFLNRAEYSINGSDWQAVFADDGISDSPKERYTLEIPLKTAGEYTIALRVFDANGNVGSARIVVRR
ncbi:MAG: hypothetical protein H0W58_00290 [Acidobacteria bacterium]|jgi:sugar lactone lactonase YvrE|nr:hypothetical protein [Acidobacteriota bacterium]